MTSTSATADHDSIVEVADQAAHMHSFERDRSSRGARETGAVTKAVTVGLIALVVAAVLVGVALRAWYLAHMPLTADESVDGLIARNALHGHFVAFYWGQHYGGVEPYLTAVLFAVLGQAGWVVRLTAVLLSALSAVLLWRIARRLVGDKLLALAAAATFWCLSVAAVVNATTEWGVRGVTMACGLGAVLFALRLLEAPRLADAAGLGASLGLGWWASPEIAYYVVPVAVLLVVAVVRSEPGERLRSWTRPAVVAVVCAAVCALPWLWSNARTQLASLRRGMFQVPPGTSYQGNLKAFAHHALPIELGLQRMLTGAWLFGDSHHGIGRFALVLLGLVLAMSIVAGVLVCLLRNWETRAVAIGLIVFPLLYAAAPASWYWGDGRYAVLFGPYAVLVLAVGASELGNAWRRSGRPAEDGRPTNTLGRATMAVVLVGFGALCLIGFHLSTGQTLRSFGQGWGNPDTASQRTADALVSHRLSTGYADYWIAYKMDLLGNGDLNITTAGTDADRSAALDEIVRRSRSSAWLFVPPANMAAALAQFGDTAMLIGPDGMSQSRFVDFLSNRHIGYRVVRAGLIVAVIPQRPVTPAQAGL